MTASRSPPNRTSVSHTSLAPRFPARAPDAQAESQKIHTGQQQWRPNPGLEPLRAQRQKNTTLSVTNSCTKCPIEKSGKLKRLLNAPKADFHRPMATKQVLTTSTIIFAALLGSGCAGQRAATSSSSGRLDREPIREVIVAGKEDIRRCYEDALEHQPDLDGRLSVRFVIDEQGDVASASTVDSELPSATIDA